MHFASVSNGKHRTSLQEAVAKCYADAFAVNASGMLLVSQLLGAYIPKTISRVGAAECGFVQVQYQRVIRRIPSRLLSLEKNRNSNRSSLTLATCNFIEGNILSRRQTPG